jgi:DnaJ family protein C protein 13
MLRPPRWPQDAETPECLWDRQLASEAAAEAAAFASAVRAQHAGGAFDWAPPQGYRLRPSRLRGELFVGGVYVRLFLKSPKFPVRDPVKFSEALAERYLQELAAAAAAEAGGGAAAAAGGGGAGGAAAAGGEDAGKAAADAALLLSAAAVALLQGHSLLCDHLAQLGYASRLLSFLAARTRRGAASSGGGGDAAGAAGGAPAAARGDELGGSALRVLHQLAASPGAAEAFATATGAPCVPTLVAAMAWGPGASVLVLEALKRCLAPGNRQRDTLVAQALSAQLPARLLGLLDWRAAGAGAPPPQQQQPSEQQQAGGGGAGGSAPAEAQEAAVLRTLAVDVLRLMAEEEGAYSAQAAAALARSEVWVAYRGQRHDMFLPSGATPEGGVAGLLTAGDTARFALPAPEAITRAPVDSADAPL